MITPSEIKEIMTSVGVIVATLVLCKGVYEYWRSSILQRADRFLKLRGEFLGDQTVNKVRGYLELDDPNLAMVPQEEKWHFLFFMEEVALLMRAKLVSREVALYMFGFYALKADRSADFWSSDFPRRPEYWLLFNAFVSDMNAVEAAKKRDFHGFARRLHV